MGFSSIDDLVNEITVNAKFARANFQKINSAGATSAAGRWHSMFNWTGTPTQGTYSGSAGVATQMNRSTTGALNLNANVSTDTRHLLNMNAYTPSTVITPATLMLCDFLLYYPACVVTGVATTLNNTATLPRYTTGDGVVCFIDVQTALGATQPALTLTYTDEAGNTGNAAPFALTAPVASAPVSTLFVTNGTPFLPLAGADKGIRKIESYTLATGTTGTVAFVLAKPICEIPLLAANVASERDFLSQIPSLPKIEDDACLGFITLIGGAMTVSQSIMGKIEYGWG